MPFPYFRNPKDTTAQTFTRESPSAAKTRSKRWKGSGGNYYRTDHGGAGHFLHQAEREEGSKAVPFLLEELD